MCGCVNIAMGSHGNTVPVLAPWWSEYRFLTLDRCLWREIIWLWHQGVKTRNSCCGHNEADATILVAEESIGRMESLGYEHWENPLDVDRRDGFYARSVEGVERVAA